MRGVAHVRSGWLRIFAAACVVAACRSERPVVPTPPDVLPGGLRWYAQLATLGRVSVDAERLFIAGTEHGELYALRRDSGIVVWHTIMPPHAAVPSTFATTVAGSVVVLADGSLFGVDRASGALRWQFDGEDGSLPGWGDPTTDSSVLYSGSGRGQVYAIEPETGAELWRAARPVPYQATAFSPVVAGGQLFVGYAEIGGVHGGLGALRTSDGALAWFHDFAPYLPDSILSGGVLSARCLGHVVASEKAVYTWLEAGDILALDRATGELLWRRTRPPNVSGNNWRYSALTDGVLVVASLDGHIEGLDAQTGDSLWAHPGFRISVTKPLTSDDESVYISFAGGPLAAFRARTGEVRWRVGFTVGAPVLLGTPAVADSSLYIGGEGVFAYRR